MNTIGVDIKKDAYRQMYEERFCPPSSVRNASNARQVAEHKRICRTCSMVGEIDVEAWAELGRMMVLDSLAPTRPDLAPGQVWSLVAAKGGWDDQGRHTNPPLVFVIEVYDDVKGVRVAQIFDEPNLVGPGDIVLGSGLGIAEGWNSYALDQADLELCFGSAPEMVETVKAVFNQNPEVAQGSIEACFRNTELIIGSRMAMEAIGRLMARHEALY